MVCNGDEGLKFAGIEHAAVQVIEPDTLAELLQLDKRIFFHRYAPQLVGKVDPRSLPTSCRTSRRAPTTSA